MTEEERNSQIAENKEWAQSTQVWLGDFEKGSEFFEWEGVQIKVPRPPSISLSATGGPAVVSEESQDTYRAWLIEYLPNQAARDLNHFPNGQQIADWWLAKHEAYKSEAGKYPKFIPPYPGVPGGETTAGQG